MRTKTAKLNLVPVILMLCLFFFIPLAMADDTDEQAQYDQAMKLIDEWRGRNDNREKAFEIGREMLQANPKSARAYTVMGRATWWQGYINEGTHDPEKLKEAQDYFRKAVELDPKFREGGYYLAVSHVTAKEYDIALSIADKLQKAYPDWPRSYYIPIQVADKKNEYGRLWSSCMKLQQKFPNDEKVIGYTEAHLVTAYIGLQQLDKAEELYLKFIKEEPDSAWNIGNYASFLCDYKKDYDLAIAYAQKALSIMDYGVGRHTLARAAYMKGGTLFNEQKYEDAEPYFMMSLEAKPNYSYSWIKLIQLNWELGKKNQDMERMSRALAAAEAAKQYVPQKANWDEVIEQISVAMKKMNEKSRAPQEPQQPQQPQQPEQPQQPQS